VASRVTVQKLANGARASYSYDDANQLLRLANLSSAGTTLSSFAYVYNAVGNRTRVVEGNGDRVTWSYDNAYQLTREVRSGAKGYAVTCTYDAAGNRLTRTDGGARTTYLLDAANQIRRAQAGAGITTYVFDACGNLATLVDPSSHRTSYAWNFHNRLISVALPASVTNSFVYNGDGLRVQRQDSTGTTNFVWDQQNILEETDAGGALQAVYNLNPQMFGQIVSQLRGSQTSLYLYDGLGSARQLVDSATTITDTYLYDAFGAARSTTGATHNRYLFMGQHGYYHDNDIDTYYIRARFHDPSTGRFLSQDPLGPVSPFIPSLGGFSPDWNPYRTPSSER
jgi:RHS repeat-associated protein